MTQQDDPIARFHGRFWPHAPAVRRVARCLVHSVADAEDLAQETFLKAFRGMDPLPSDAHTRAWLMTLLRHTHIDRLRAAAVRMEAGSLDPLEIEAPDPATADAWPDGAGGSGSGSGTWALVGGEVACDQDPIWDDPDALLASFTDEQLITALRTLPEAIRWTLLLTDVERMDHHEVAEVLAVPVGTIQSRASRGRAVLRQVLLPLARRQRGVP